MGATPYPPTDYTAVLSATAGLTAGFGMGPGDPRLHGRAHGRCSHGLALGRRPDGRIAQRGTCLRRTGASGMKKSSGN